MLGIGVRANCHSWARTILMYGCRHTPVGGAGSKHLGPTNENCTQISFVCLCRLYVPACCAVLYCSGVCCATLFRWAPLSALAYRDALCAMLCAMLHQQRMAATAIRAATTLFHGAQVPATSETLRCRHTPVGGAGPKHPGPANENCAHFSSHLISCVHLRWLSRLGRCTAPCRCNVCCAAPCYASECHSALQCSALR